MKFLCGLGLLLLVSCDKPTYPDAKVSESVRRLAFKEYGLVELKAHREKNTLWVSLPVERLTDENFELDREAMEILRKISFVSSRVLFSSDGAIEFLALVLYDRQGVELKYVRHIDDIKKFREMYISDEDYFQRADLKLGFSPEILGKRVVENLVEKSSREGRLAGTSALVLGKKQEISEKLPETWGLQPFYHTMRLEENKALVYLETAEQKNRLLFLIDASFFDILKDLFLLFLSRDDKGKSDASSAPLSLPVIADMWDLNAEPWPEEYAAYSDFVKTEQLPYFSKIELMRFLEEQVERRIRKKFKDRDKEWDIGFKKLEISIKKNIIQVTRDVELPKKARYHVDPDHEIALAVATVIGNYDLSYIDLLMIRTPSWQIKKVINRSELMELKPKKWKKETKETARKKLSLREIVDSILYPYYY